MTKTVSFFIPIRYSSNGPRQFIENYFYFGGERVYVASGKSKGISCEDPSYPWRRTALKVAACLVFLPITLIMLIAKAISRWSYPVRLEAKKEEAAPSQEQEIRGSSAADGSGPAPAEAVAPSPSSLERTISPVVEEVRRSSAADGSGPAPAEAVVPSPSLQEALGPFEIAKVHLLVLEQILLFDKALMLTIIACLASKKDATEFSWKPRFSRLEGTSEELQKHLQKEAGEQLRLKILEEIQGFENKLIAQTLKENGMGCAVEQTEKEGSFQISIRLFESSQATAIQNQTFPLPQPSQTRGNDHYSLVVESLAFIWGLDLKIMACLASGEKEIQYFWEPRPSNEEEKIKSEVLKFIQNFASDPTTNTLKENGVECAVTCTEEGRGFQIKVVLSHLAKQEESA